MEKPAKPKRAKVKPTGDYAVGYCKPPASAKWQPGKSANPSGRPKKILSPHEMFMAEAWKPVTVKVGGELVETTKLEVVFIALFQQAISGDIRSVRTVLEYSRQAYSELTKAALLEEKTGVLDFSLSAEHEKLFQQIMNVEEAADNDPKALK